MRHKTRTTNLEGAEQALVHAHHGAGIVELAAIVGGAEERHELTLGEELVAVLDDLVSTADEVHVVFLQEAGDDVWAKGERDTAVVLGPAGDVLVRIGPEQIAEETAVGDLEVDWSALGSGSDKRGADVFFSPTYISRAHDAADLLHRVQIGAQAAVHGEDLLVNDSRNGQAVEAVGECLPQLDVVATLALVVEAVDAVDRRALVVAAQDEEILGELDLVGKEQADGLERLLAAIYVVAEEEVVGLGREAAILEEAEQVVVLPVDIAANLR